MTIQPSATCPICPINPSSDSLFYYDFTLLSQETNRDTQPEEPKNPNTAFVLPLFTIQKAPGTVKAVQPPSTQHDYGSNR
jgi:hypothetical protein